MPAVRQWVYLAVAALSYAIGFFTAPATLLTGFDVSNITSPVQSDLYSPRDPFLDGAVDLEMPSVLDDDGDDGAGHDDLSTADVLENYAALDRFRSDQGPLFGGRYVDIRVCDYSWGENYSLADEISLFKKTHGVEAFESLGFSERKLPPTQGEKTRVRHLLYTKPGATETNQTATYAFPALVVKREADSRAAATAANNALRAAKRNHTAAAAAAAPTNSNHAKALSIQRSRRSIPRKKFFSRLSDLSGFFSPRVRP